MVEDILDAVNQRLLRRGRVVMMEDLLDTISERLSAPLVRSLTCRRRRSGSSLLGGGRLDRLHVRGTLGDLGKIEILQVLNRNALSPVDEDLWSRRGSGDGGGVDLDGDLDRGVRIAVEDVLDAFAQGLLVDCSSTAGSCCGMSFVVGEGLFDAVTERLLGDDGGLDGRGRGLGDGCIVRHVRGSLSDLGQVNILQVLDRDVLSSVNEDLRRSRRRGNRGCVDLNGNLNGRMRLMMEDLLDPLTQRLHFDDRGLGGGRCM